MLSDHRKTMFTDYQVSWSTLSLNWFLRCSIWCLNSWEAIPSLKRVFSKSCVFFFKVNPMFIYFDMGLYYENAILCYRNADLKHNLQKKRINIVNGQQLKHRSMDWIMELQKIMINIDTYLNRHWIAQFLVIHGLVVVLYEQINFTNELWYVRSTKKEEETKPM